MREMIIVKATTESEAGVMPGEKLRSIGVGAEGLAAPDDPVDTGPHLGVRKSAASCLSADLPRAVAAAREVTRQELARRSLEAPVSSVQRQVAGALWPV